MTVTARVLDCLLREDAFGLRTNGAVADGWLRNGDLRVPVRAGGYLADLTVRAPYVEAAGARVEGLAGILDVLRDALIAPDDVEAREGWAAFAAECRAAEAVVELDAATEEADRARIAALPVRGFGGLLRHEALAARLDHPVYPTARARPGIDPAELAAYAPEHAPTFPLRWAAVPTLTTSGSTPAWWPTRAMLGLVGEGPVVPVHPLYADALPPTAQLAPEPYLDVAPTLSMRTLVLVQDPSTHVKVPLPTATLGARNRRTLQPGTLPDGARTQALLQDVAAREPAYARSILHADETVWGHAGDERLAYLVRRHPERLARSRIVPVAAFLAPTSDGRLVFEEVAEEAAGGDPAALLEAYLGLLLGWHGLLWEYGIALEAHQQNVALVVDGPRLRLLYKDDDGPRLDRARLGRLAPRPEEYDDQRVWDADEIDAMVVTITLHLCGAAIVHGLDAAGVLPLREGMAILRDQVEKTPLRELVRGDRLPVKTMVTAGTLLPKHRTGARDVNKHYGSTCPNYLLAAP